MVVKLVQVSTGDGLAPVLRHAVMVRRGKGHVVTPFGQQMFGITLISPTISLRPPSIGSRARAVFAHKTEQNRVTVAAIPQLTDACVARERPCRQFAEQPSRIIEASDLSESDWIGPQIRAA